MTTEAPGSPSSNATYEEKDIFVKWHEDDDMAKCYILASMTNVLQQQPQELSTATDIMARVKEMFGEQNRTTRKLVIKGLVCTKTVEGTPAREHMLKMIAYFNKLDVLQPSSLDSES
ncbi:uncharacterized protein LOC143888650 [Tasmannia lanceolata]|uniref:uncharacterized protein LOC143888650 n=1 Tax=Tasmannia lanceolata TaxID=3420 RepID=UPI0040628047